MTLAGVFPALVWEDIDPAVTNRGKHWRGASPFVQGDPVGFGTAPEAEKKGSGNGAGRCGE